MLLRLLVLSIALVCATQAATADTFATTDDGLKVLLRSNGTWVPASAVENDGEEIAVLTLEQREDLPRGCRIGLRLQNDLPAQVRTLVLRFTAYKGDDIAFETVSRGWSYIKPTMSQYQEVTFRGITCDEISSVEVAAARNCHVGDLTKYSADADDCLRLFRVAPSDIMAIAKYQPLD